MECPRLRATYYEALRLRKRDLGFRKVDQDTNIGGKVLRGGNLGLIPVCQLHDNNEVFGNDANQFNPDRFYKQPDLANSIEYKPYGGGKTYCPGRFFAMQEIFGFLAVMIGRYNIRLDCSLKQNQTFPIPDESSLTLGVSRPVPGSDVWVELSNH